MRKQEITLRAYGKVNLFLKVLGKREDGFHDIYTLFHKITLYDEVRLQLTPSRSLTVTMTCDDASLPSDSRNLCVAGAEMLMQKVGLKADIALSLSKRIPVSAGLGGGSSDAASVLRGLGDIFHIPEDVLLGCAAELGSDIAFFLSGFSSAFGYGRGEKLAEYSFDVVLPRFYLLIFPHISISAGWAYRALGKKEGSVRTPQVFHEGMLFSNDLQPPCFSQYPLLGRICKELCDEGASHGMLSGSGSTLFGVYADEESLQKAATVFSKRYPDFRVIPVEGFS